MGHGENSLLVLVRILANVHSDIPLAKFHSVLHSQKHNNIRAKKTLVKIENWMKINTISSKIIVWSEFHWVQQN